MHDRYLRGQGHHETTPFESFHWAESSQLFNKELSKQLIATDRDAIWMATIFMSWITLHSIETDNPELVWPLSSRMVSGIPWLPVQRGIRTIWEMVDMTRADSIVSRASQLGASSPRCLALPPPEPGIQGVPVVLVRLCDLDAFSGVNNNPYYSACRVLSELLLDYGGSGTNSLRFLAFVNTFTPAFEDLLSRRDARALVLMAIWYELVPIQAWYMLLRASLEKQAIWIYLSRYHGHDARVLETLNAITKTQEDGIYLKGGLWM